MLRKLLRFSVDFALMCATVMVILYSALNWLTKCDSWSSGDGRCLRPQEVLEDYAYYTKK